MRLAYVISTLNWIFGKKIIRFSFLFFFFFFFFFFCFSSLILIIDAPLQYCKHFRNFEQADLVENLRSNYLPYRFCIVCCYYYDETNGISFSIFLNHSVEETVLLLLLLLLLFCTKCSYDKWFCIESWQNIANWLILSKAPRKKMKTKKNKKNTKTYLYNFDSLKPHFYIVKLEFTGIYIFFSYLCLNT